jgi:hypothetical protein
MTFERIEIDVIAREHANMDSFPLRFGFYYPQNMTLEIYDIREKETQPNGRQKLKAKFLDPYGDEHEGTFVLMPTWSNNLKLVTVWRNDQDNEFYLSELMKRLRKAGRIDVNDLLDLHQRYISGELSTMDALFGVLLEKKAELSQFDYSSAQSDIHAEYKKQIEHLKSENTRVRTIAQTAIDGLKEQDSIITQQTEEIKTAKAEMSSQQNEYNLLQSEFEEYKRENARASSRREIATLSNEVRLAEVNRSVFHRGSSCTELVFTDGSRKYMKTSTFDRDLSITQKAERLIGDAVKITCWDPVHEPGKWSSQGYFRGIYAVYEG